MSRINSIQNAIIEMEGGAFQKFLDVYLFKKNNFTNIHTLGVQTATNKPTKGTPDSFVRNEDGTYTLIMYGSVKAIPFSKMKNDILSCFEKDKLELDSDKINKIICVYTSTNIHIEQMEELTNLIDGIEIEMLGLSTISHDLLTHYPNIASDFLSISIDTGQIYEPNEFIEKYDENGMNAPLNIDLFHRDKELLNLKSAIDNSQVTMVSGQSGVGKTRLAIEVCKKYEREGWRVLCIKNNGMQLYDDIRYYFSETADYLLFIDDANQTTNLEYILNYILSPPKGVNIKIIVTVRDYAKSRLKGELIKYCKPCEVVIKSLSNKEIKNILINGLGIKNGNYLDRIVKIAKGNPRLAILAGETSLDKGFMAINNAKDIFKNYYGRIIDNQQLDKTSISVLFVISLLGKINIKESKIALELLDELGINHDTFLRVCHELNEKELLDLYQDEIAGISDQSLGNYVLEYFLLDKKYLSIQELLKISFPEFKNKIVYALNTLISLFNTQPAAEYIEEEISKSWDRAGRNQQQDYLKCFYQLNEEKTLSILNKTISEMEIITVDLCESDFENSKNSYRADDLFEVEVLSGFKHLYYFQDATNLLLLIFDKRPDLASEIYRVFSEELGYDLKSQELDYKKENEAVGILWRHSSWGENHNSTLLLLFTLKKLLKCEVQKTIPGSDGESISMILITNTLSEGNKRLRSLIWDILEQLYENELYKNIIESILSDFYTSGLEDEEAIQVFSHDITCIEKKFVDYWITPTFEQSKVLYTLLATANSLDVKLKSVFEKYKSNSDFMVYIALTGKRIREVPYEEENVRNLEDLKTHIKQYESNDFCNMFRLCKNLEVKSDKEAWILSNGINSVFVLLENDSERFIQTVENYLKYGAPYGHFPNRILEKIVENTNFEKAMSMVESYSFNYKNIWLSTLFEIAPVKSINKDMTKELLIFFSEEVENDNPVFPNILHIKKYEKIDSKVIGKVSNHVLQAADKNPYVARNFIGSIYDESRVEALLEIFKDEMRSLEELYSKTIEGNFDYKGLLLEKLIQRNPCYWSEYILRISGADSMQYKDTGIFKKIWTFDNFTELIEFAYNTLLIDKYGYMSEYSIATVFPKNPDISDKQKKWLMDYICQNYSDRERMQNVFNIIYIAFEDEKIEYILEFLKKSTNIQQFKDVPLSPMSYSWSGSQVPLIDKRIVFVTELISQLKGIEFIEHRSYLKERLSDLERYRRSVQKEEYLSAEDIS